jgi:hypothetical protein
MLRTICHLLLDIETCRRQPYSKGFLKEQCHVMNIIFVGTVLTFYLVRAHRFQGLSKDFHSATAHI